MTIGHHISWLISRIGHFITTWPKRWYRLLKHMVSVFTILYKIRPIPVHYQRPIWMRFMYWMVEIVFYVIDLLGVPEIFEILWHCIHWHYKPLSATHLSILETVYGHHLKTTMILTGQPRRLFSHPSIAAFVTFQTINFISTADDELLIHEACHVMQYQKNGSVYIFRSIMGQFSMHGYNYSPALITDLSDGNTIDSLFNYEQQAEIFTDHYRFMKGLNGLYCELNDANISRLNQYRNKLLS